MPTKIAKTIVFSTIFTCSLSFANPLIPPDGNVYHGVSVDMYRSGGMTHEQKLQDFEDAVGKKVAFLHWFIAPYTNGNRARFVGRYQEQLLDRCVSQGKIPFINFSFQFQGHPEGWSSFDELLSGTYDDMLLDMVNLYSSYNKPMIMSLNHEMNGIWYRYSQGNKYGTNATTEKYIEAYRYVHDFFKNHGNTNVQFAWVISGGGYVRHQHQLSSYKHHISEYYPGDRYVDWVGWDGYNNLKIADVEKIIISLKKYNKPIIHKEWGISESRANFYAGYYPGEAPNYPGHEKWIEDYFKLIEKNNEVKLIVYSQKKDSRINRAGSLEMEKALNMYRRKISSSKYLDTLIEASEENTDFRVQ